MKLIQLTFLVVIAFIPVQLMAQTRIPEYCFVDGEVDCKRQGCKAICDKMTRPKNQVSSKNVSDSGLDTGTHNNTTKDNKNAGVNNTIRDDSLVLDTKQGDKKLVPLPDYKVCMGADNSELNDAVNKYNYFVNAVENDKEIIKNGTLDKEQAFTNKKDDEERVDTYEHQILMQSCYMYKDICIQGPDKIAKSLLNEYSEIMVSINVSRKELHYYYLNCIDPGVECHDDMAKCINLNKSGCKDYLMEAQRMEELEQMRQAQLEKIRTLQCTE